uniref:Waprin-Phi1 n=1 Tax=Philodryas olfersii TaxID=120305 RepID=WAP1_PHIOL|nr:RecName: Full=Waprin-Phi1; Flags: Precursor [Philodryas olfersii]ABU68542.1 Waprin-Phi1 [Philodryas olfersii]
MTLRRGSCPLLLFSLVGLLTTCAQEPDAAGQNTTAVAEKAGTCPQAELEMPDRNCTEACQSDAGCEENKKCCRTGCGTSCQIPDEKPGSCPNVDTPIPPLGLCKTTCSKDSDCSETKKCCKNGCGFMTCTTARP